MLSFDDECAGIELDRHYAFCVCGPSRTAIQSGRNPAQVQLDNNIVEYAEPKDPVNGFQGMARNQTGIGTKMAAAGYETHFYGKWDAGMATPDHTPRGRGYMSSLAYFHHTTDHWDQTEFDCKPKERVKDMWIAEMGKTERPAVEYTSICEGEKNGPHWKNESFCRPGPKGDEWYGGYADSIYQRQVLKAINGYNDREKTRKAQGQQSKPLFLTWSTHGVHAPLQLPSKYVEKYKELMEYPSWDWASRYRMQHNAMINYIDDSVKNVTQALKDQGLWNNTLVVFTSDNGGPWFGNNYPLRGGKSTNFEGGVRVDAFVSGGVLNEKMRGTKYPGLVTAWDWYATFCDIAGIDPTDRRAEAANLPPVDSHSMASVLAGWKTESPREQVVLGREPRYQENKHKVNKEYLHFLIESVIRKDGLKIIIGDQGLHRTMIGHGWPVKKHPVNKTLVFCPHDKDCSAKCRPYCFFNVRDDPEERTRLSVAEGTLKAEDKQDMIQRLHDAQKAVFRPVDTYFQEIGPCSQSIYNYDGFWGPWLE